MNLKSLITTLALIGALFGTSCSTQTQAHNPESHDSKIIAKLGTIYSEAELDGRPREKVRAPAAYPYAMINDRIIGKVICEVLLNSNGDIVSVIVKEFSHSEFYQPAKSACERWKFRPGKKDNQPVACRIDVIIDFTPPKQ